MPLQIVLEEMEDELGITDHVTPVRELEEGEELPQGERPLHQVATVEHVA